MQAPKKKPQSISVDPQAVKNLTLNQLIKHAEALGLHVQVRIIKNNPPGKKANK